MILPRIRSLNSRGINERGYHEAIGEGYFHGLMDGEGLLGPFREGWKTQLCEDRNGRLVPAYVDKSGRVIKDDPRVGALPEPWQFRHHVDEEIYNIYVNGQPGETIEKDPRMTAEALRKRGLDLQKIFLR